MRSDWYLRLVLTVIGAALVYLCVVFTAFPPALAQGTRTPGESTAPGEMVIVGWRLAPDAAFPVQVPGRVDVTGDMKVINDVRVTGRVQTEQVPRTTDRVVLAGWEEMARANAVGVFKELSEARKKGLPTLPLP